MVFDLFRNLLELGFPVDECRLVFTDDRQVVWLIDLAPQLGQWGVITLRLIQHRILEPLGYQLLLQLISF